MPATPDLTTRLKALAMDAITLHGLAQGLDLLLNDVNLGPSGPANAALASARILCRETNALAERLDRLSADLRKK
jgi:hypothetical protein